MHDVTSFGLLLLLVSGALSAALLASKLSARVTIPSAALFLVASAVASDLFPSLEISISTVERIATIALIVILFDGGSSIGWRKFRVAAAPIAWLGVLGTFATAGVIACFAHWAFSLTWITAGLIGAAIAPTDPAVMFSVFGDREVTGRTGTILEGESGANDPVGIALMLGLIELATHADATFWVVVRVFAEQMSIGLAIGVIGGLLERRLMKHVSLPSAGLYTVRTLALAGLVYGVATVAHGSGFLAVFVAGLLVGDVHAPFKHEIEVFQDGLSTLAEITVFVALGLTIGVIGGLLERRLMKHVSLPSAGLYTVRTLALAGLVYGVATVAHGSGFLAVFVAGLLVGDVHAPFKHEIEVFQDGLSTLAEITVFVALGLTIGLGAISGSVWAEGVALAAFLAVVARPVVVGALLLPARLDRGERLFVMWGGLKGAVPILLAAFAIAADVADAQRIYETVFVVVLVSVVVQGGTIAPAANRLGIQIRRVAVTPRDEPSA